jgi:hypothetical protein
MLRWTRPDRAVAVALVFAAWTLFVWTGRLRNLVAEPGDLLEASRWSLVASVAFTGLGLAVVAAALVRWSGRGADRLAVAVAPLAALTVGVWLVRAVDIALGDHGAGFIAVHLVLAVVSIGLAAAASVSLRRGGAAGTSTGRLPSKRWVSL